MAYKKDINTISGKINSPGSMSGIISHGRPLGGTVGKELEIVYYTGSETDTAKTTIDNKNKIIYVDAKKLPNSLRIDDRQQVFSETASGEKYGIIHTFDGSTPVNLVLSNYKFGKLSDREYCLLKDGEPYGDTIIIPEDIIDYVDELPEVDEKNNIQFARLNGDELYAAEYHNDKTPSTDILADTSIKGGSPYTVPNAQLCINTNYVTITDIVNGFNYAAFPDNKPFKIGKAKGLGSISFNVNTSKPYKVYIRDFITKVTAEKGVGAKVLVNGVEYSLDPTKDGTGLPKRVAISLPADVTTVTLESVEQDASVGSDNRRCFFFEGISIDGEEIHVAEWHKLARTSYVDAEIETVDNKITTVEEKLTTVEETVADNTTKLEGLTGRVFTIETEMGTVQIFDADYLPTAGKDYLNKILRVDNKLYQCISQGDPDAFAKHYSFENVAGTSEVTGDNYEHFANEVTDNFKDNFTAVDAGHIWASTKVYRDAGYCKLGNSSTDGNLHLYRRDTTTLPITYIGAVIKPWSATKASGLVISAKDAVNEVISDPILALPGEEEITVSLPGLNIGSESCEIDLASKGYNYGVDEAGSDLYTDHRIHIKELIVHYGVISYAWVEVSGGAKIEIVDALPEIGNENTIYLLKEQEESGTTEDNNLYLQYIYKDGKYRLTGGGSTAATVKITYSELKALRDNSKLIPGQQYRIIDYVTTTAQENTQSAGHQFDIIVTADDEKTLNETARAALHEGDEYFQKITSSTKLVSANWKEGVTLNSITEEYKMSDDQEAYLTPMAENKAFTKMLTITNKDGIKVPCLFNPDPVGNGQDDYLVYCGTYEWKKTTNTLLTIYYTITEDKSQEYKGQCPSHAEDIFVEIAYKDIDGISTPVLYKEDLGFYLSDNSSVDYGDEFRYLDDYVVDGVTYNRWLKYEDPTSSYYQILTNIIVVNNQFTVSPEEFRSAVHEITVIYDKWQECDSNGEIRPGSVYYVLTNNLVNAETVINTSVKTLANLAAWEIKYCLDNDTNRFAWALDGQAIINLNSFGSNGKPLTRQQRFDGPNFGGVYSEYQYAWGTFEDVDNGDNTNFIYSKNATLINGETVYNSNEGKLQNAEVVEGKGVIYFMKDEWNNEAPYDFKNIQFKRYKITQCQKSQSLVGKYLGVENVRSYTINTGDFIWCYTFTWINENNVIEDCSVVGQALTNDEGQYSGIFNNKLAECSSYIAVYPEAPESFGIALNNIVIQYSYEYDGGFFSGIHDNTFKDNCYNNTLGSNCRSNTFAASCCHSVFEGSCEYNTFGNGCSYNIFGNGCYGNTFGDNCNGNIFDTNCYSNTFGTSCSSNTLGDGCEYNILGAHCFSNTFGPSCFCNTLNNTCSYIKLGTRCSCNTFGNGCSYIVFGGSSNYPSDYYQYNIIDNGCSYLCLYSNATGSYNYQLQNVHIHSGIKGAYPNYKIITVERNLSHSTTILAPGSKEIILDEE